MQSIEIFVRDLKVGDIFRWSRDRHWHRVEWIDSENICAHAIYGLGNPNETPGGRLIELGENNFLSDSYERDAICERLLRDGDYSQLECVIKCIMCENGQIKESVISQLIINKKFNYCPYCGRKLK